MRVTDWIGEFKERYDLAGCLTSESEIKQSDDFIDSLPKKPYCTDYLPNGLSIRPKQQAINCKYLQLNSPQYQKWLSFDIDREDAYNAYDDENVAVPNCIVMNPTNGHVHYLYRLEVPVSKTEFSRIRPFKYTARVERGMTRRLRADRWYNGLIVKNPLHDCWKTTWWRERPYKLAELHHWLEYEDMRRFEPVYEEYGLGRNCEIFDQLRRRAYQVVLQFKAEQLTQEDFQDYLYQAALKINQLFPSRLLENEVRHIAKSVAKWTWKTFSMEKFSEIQSERGKKSSNKRWGNGYVSQEKLQPWNEKGISRSTFFRRKKSQVSKL